MNPGRRCGALALVLALAAGTAACGGGANAKEGKRLRLLAADTLPSQMAGLDVEREKLGEGIKDQRRTYLDAVGLFSFRKDDLLQATLQISKFSTSAKYTSRDFRQGILEQIGSTVPRQFRMGSQTVYLTTGKRQNVVIWFKDRFLFVLSSREEFGQGRKLLRELIDVDL